MPKMTKNDAANWEQLFIDLGLQNDVRNHWFWHPKSYCQPESTPRRSKRLPRWLERLSNRSKTEGVQKTQNCVQDAPVMAELMSLQCKTHSLSFLLRTLYLAFHRFQLYTQNLSFIMEKQSQVYSTSTTASYLRFPVHGFLARVHLPNFMIALYNLRTHWIS